jgi:hypothetical protein
MFVNKIPFLVTTSRGLHFGTVENLVNRQVPTVKDALNKVLAQYARRGFRVATIHADPEFMPLQAEIGHVQFNWCAQNEHVPESASSVQSKTVLAALFTFQTYSTIDYYQVGIELCILAEHFSPQGWCVQHPISPILDDRNTHQKGHLN